MTETQRFDPDAYLRRIGWEGERRADLATLRGVHLAHMRAIPFENLDALRRIAPSLDPADLTAKLLHSRRGGYCYEHNTLFAGVLEALGFRVTRLAARVVVGADRIDSRPRTHMALLVEAPGDPQPYLADVGFGAIGALLEPVPAPRTTGRSRCGCSRPTTGRRTSGPTSTRSPWSRSRSPTSRSSTGTSAPTLARPSPGASTSRACPPSATCCSTAGSSPRRGRTERSSSAR